MTGSGRDCQFGAVLDSGLSIWQGTNGRSSTAPAQHHDPKQTPANGRAERSLVGGLNLTGD
jgi:hypothetical protein